MNSLKVSPDFYKRFHRYYTYIEPVIKDPVVKGYFTLIASIFLITFFIFFALSPTATTIVGLFRRIDDQKKTIAAMDTKIANLIIAQENYGQMEEKLPVLLKAIPDIPTPETILAAINSEAANAGVVLKSIEFSEIEFVPTTGPKPLTPSDAKLTPQVSLGIPTAKFSLSAAGPDDSVRSFISRLENNSRILRITVLVKSRSDQTGQTVDIAGVGYYQ